MCQYDEFVTRLKGQADLYIHHLETMFGPPRAGFLFRSIGRSTDRFPRIFYPLVNPVNGMRVVDIHIGRRAWDRCSPDQGPWQVAHECVHLLDPVNSGESTYLEEGVATWFQNKPEFHSEAVRRYIERNAQRVETYIEAEKLVRACMPQLIPAVRAIRASGVRISDITADELAPHLPGVDRGIAERLCTRFT